MFQIEQQAIEDKIKTFAATHAIELAALEWKPIPFSGEWGISTSFFASAALEARAGKKVVVPQRAQEIAAQVKVALIGTPGISRIEAVKGYLNLYFETAEYAGRVVETVLEQKGRFGSGPATGQRVFLTTDALHFGYPGVGIKLGYGFNGNRYRGGIGLKSGSLVITSQLSRSAIAWIRQSPSRRFRPSLFIHWGRTRAILSRQAELDVLPHNQPVAHARHCANITVLRDHEARSSSATEADTHH